MERLRHARTPVHLNAVLIGEKTVPKGCRVRNVSKQGLLLQCDADGRIPTFKDGDHVDIHLLFHRSGGTKYHTIAAKVRHVDVNSIGVEFCQPDAELVKLIESYRVDDSQVIEATIAHRRKPAGPERPPSVVAMPAPRSSAPGQRQRHVDKGNGKRLAYIGGLSLAIAVIIFTAGYLRTFDLASRVSRLETLVKTHDQAFAGAQSRPVAAANTGSVVADGDTPPGPVAAAGESDSEPLDEAHVEDMTIASAVKGEPTQAGPETGSPAGMEASVAPEIAAPVAVTGQPAMDENKPDVVTSGPWVINLMSSPNKSDADRFAENAGKRGVQVEQTSVSLNGREFFRVQITGFATEREARAAAGPVQAKLDLKDVWIFKP